MATAGKDTRIWFTDDAGTSWSEIDGINDISFDISVAELDTTDTKGVAATATEDIHTYIAGLKDGDLSISGDLEWSDTAQTDLRANVGASDGNDGIAIAFDGTNGLAFQVMITKQSFPAAVDGKAQVQYTFKLIGVTEPLVLSSGTPTNEF